MPQPAFTPDALARHLFAVLGNPPVLLRAAAAAAKEARPDAARRLADLIQSLIRAAAPVESR
jgi:UDP-N-acetylglucosamine:LPS N-acetylglucosamine transferase